jgi:ClpP class serine protease
MLSTDELASDVGSVVYGEQAVSMGLIDRLGGLHDALECLHRMIDKQKK